MITMFDSIDLSQFPPNPEAVAGYTGGHWPTYSELVKRYPRAHHLSIAVQANQHGRCLDVEPGDASNSQAGGWLDHYADKSQGPPVLYTSASNVNAMKQTVGGSHGHYLIWSAHYTFREHICAPDGCGYPTADATQWTDKALGHNLDQSLCRDYFFPGASPAPTPTPPQGDEIVSVAVAELQGVPHVFVEDSKGAIWYTWQKKGEHSWHGGVANKQIAGLTQFAPAPK